ncbi:AraC family transcriptional regulator [Parabacteroides sp. PF5-6]|uniref:helix-turn-helix domain-containing protein n=1 Tax=Parabacteroides sp. PF5-6 TaxID=1742403 RepID=UPI002406D89B|nr:AraC family transcriptional regulator [Parabacteroides sp. PF5-6]MDF9828773.1 AraC-like DNA-binding protein [Parabacteroides sp. PF5-6]
MKNMYFFTLLLSSCLIVTMGITLFCCPEKKDGMLKSYGFARRLLAIAYLLLGGLGLFELGATAGQVNFLNPLAIVITLSLGFLQSLLFTFSFTTLLNGHFLPSKRFLTYLWINLFLIGCLFVGVYAFTEPDFLKLAYGCGGCYYVLLGCYILLFEREYRLYKIRRDEFFAESASTARLRWVRRSFYLSLLIGIWLCLSFLLPEKVYPVYITLYTVFYIYFAIKYINYPAVFQQLLPVLEPEVTAPAGGSETSIEARLQQWIERKGFVAHGLTLDLLAHELQTNRTYLSAYINQTNQQNFRRWISALRIEESKEILLSHPELSIEEVGNRVGIPDRSSYYRQFLNLTGLSPTAFRKDDRARGA